MRRISTNLLMESLPRVLLVWVMIFESSACTVAQQTPVGVAPTPIRSTPTSLATPFRSCKPTFDDGVSPSYKPDAPERTVVGQGHILTGFVRSSVNCEPIGEAKLEFWPEEGELGHPDSSRATFFTDQQGYYRFECNPPEHIHMRISAPGYRTIGVNSYHPEGQAEGIFDIVLVPE
jgi:protocatechuate 3,4-dioxygenase beta subunit